MKEVIFSFDEDGNFEADAKGFKGKGCADAIDRLIGQIGATAKTRKIKPEYNQREVRAKAKQRVGG